MSSYQFKMRCLLVCLYLFQDNYSSLIEFRVEKFGLISKGKVIHNVNIIVSWSSDLFV